MVPAALVPQPDQVGTDRDTANLGGHQGISFDQWLDLFLDYAIGLAILHRREEAYQVCEAARDSTVFQSSSSHFRIHVAWSGWYTRFQPGNLLIMLVCAIYTSDEEKSVTVARHLMKDGATTDSYRMFALLSSLCQSPITWYTSGPAQKFILRQIRFIDTEQMTISSCQPGSGDDANAIDTSSTQLDVCLLMLYGHILFTSTSYTYALGMSIEGT